MTHELDAWLRAQARREERIVRLEDALLTDRWAPYFAYRLRFFAARTVVIALVHALRIVLLLGTFATSGFLFVVLASALAAIGTDAWWGALEVMRSRIRHLQRSGSRHRIPDEIASWLGLATRVTAVGLVACLALLAVVAMGSGGLAPAGLVGVLVLAGAAVNVVTGTYHSGAYAVRRVYRPLPSLLATELVSLATLLVLWPLLGGWAFAVAEAMAVATVAALSLWYTGRTYRSLAFPTITGLLRTRAPLPRPGVLRTALAPGLAFGVVGLEVLVLVAVLAAVVGRSDPALVAALAGISPVMRAGFEWARLLYFDMARLGVRLLAGLRHRFERAVLGLSVVVGGVTWLVAVSVALLLLGLRDAPFLAILLPFLVARALLAAAQMRAFTWRAYARLALVGSAVALASLAILALVPAATEGILGLTLALVAATLLLAVLPDLSANDERIAMLTDWLERLRRVAGPVTVHRLSFDRRELARGVSTEERRAARWRRGVVARRIARRVAHLGGATSLLEPFELVWWLPSAHGSLPEGPTDGARATRWAVTLGAGLARSWGPASAHPDGASAARALVGGGERADRWAATAEPDRWAATAEPDRWTATAEPQALAQVFRSRFPEGVVYDVGAPAPAALRWLSSRERAAVLRAALLRVRGSLGQRDSPHDVTALVVDGRLRSLYLVGRREPRAARARWASLVRRANILIAATGVGVSEPGPRPRVDSRRARQGDAGRLSRSGDGP